MTDAEVQKRLFDLEDGLTERKPEGDSGDILKTIVGFANSVQEDQTGILFIGVRDDGTVTGLRNSDKLQKTVSDICAHKCYPQVKSTQRVLPHGGEHYLAVIVPFSTDRPHFGGPAWVRDGSKTVIASAQLFDELVHSRNSKVYEILKYKGKVVPVEIVSLWRGNPLPSAPIECRILECTPHYICLENLGSISEFSEPLENVSLKWISGRRCIQLSIQRVVA